MPRATPGTALRSPGARGALAASQEGRSLADAWRLLENATEQAASSSDRDRRPFDPRLSKRQHPSGLRERLQQLCERFGSVTSEAPADLASPRFSRDASPELSPAAALQEVQQPATAPSTSILSSLGAEWQPLDVVQRFAGLLASFEEVLAGRARLQPVSAAESGQQIINIESPASPVEEPLPGLLLSSDSTVAAGGQVMQTAGLRADASSQTEWPSLWLDVFWRRWSEQQDNSAPGSPTVLVLLQVSPRMCPQACECS